VGLFGSYPFANPYDHLPLLQQKAPDTVSMALRDAPRIFAIVEQVGKQDSGNHGRNAGIVSSRPPLETQVLTSARLANLRKTGGEVAPPIG
jgi:hypothetical protein